jgi:hypothetical protein
MPDRWEHRVEVFGMEWRRQERLPDAAGLQRKLNEWGADGWELVAFEVVRDEHQEPAADGAPPDSSPRAAYLVILKRPSGA